MELEHMSKDERSLLLFLETCAVDHGGAVNVAHMNGTDMDRARGWAAIGFLTYFERKASECLAGTKHTHAVALSEDAWAIAHAERRARAKRMDEKRTWRTVAEKRAAA